MTTTIQLKREEKSLRFEQVSYKGRTYTIEFIPKNNRALPEITLGEFEFNPKNSWKAFDINVKPNAREEIDAEKRRKIKQALSTLPLFSSITSKTSTPITLHTTLTNLDIASEEEAETLEMQHTESDILQLSIEKKKKELIENYYAKKIALLEREKTEEKRQGETEQEEVPDTRSFWKKYKKPIIVSGLTILSIGIIGGAFYFALGAGIITGISAVLLGIWNRALAKLKSPETLAKDYAPSLWGRFKSWLFSSEKKEIEKHYLEEKRKTDIKIQETLLSATDRIDLSAQNIKIDSSRMKVIIDYLREKTVKSLNLSNNRIDDKTFKVIYDSLKNNNEIQELDLSNNQISATSTSRSDLIDLLAENPKIKSINIKNNPLVTKLKNNPEPFLIHLKKNFSITNLHGLENSFKEPYRTEMIDQLDVNKYLQTGKIETQARKEKITELLKIKLTNNMTQTEIPCDDSLQDTIFPFVKRNQTFASLKKDNDTTVKLEDLTFAYTQSNTDQFKQFVKAAKTNIKTNIKNLLTNASVHELFGLLNLNADQLSSLLSIIYEPKEITVPAASLFISELERNKQLESPINTTLRDFLAGELSDKEKLETSAAEKPLPTKEENQSSETTQQPSELHPIEQALDITISTLKKEITALINSKDQFKKEANHLIKFLDETRIKRLIDFFKTPKQKVIEDIIDEVKKISGSLAAGNPLKIELDKIIEKYTPSKISTHTKPLSPSR